MGIKIGSTRIGHRVGGFYVSTPITGRNAGKQVRIGHKLPGGFYGSHTLTTTSGQTQASKPASPRVVAFSLSLTGALILALSIASGSWILMGSYAIVLVFLMLRGRANLRRGPQVALITGRSRLTHVVTHPVTHA
jgi:hypothetical protein